MRKRLALTVVALSPRRAGEDAADGLEVAPGRKRTGPWSLGRHHRGPTVPDPPPSLLRSTASSGPPCSRLPAARRTVDVDPFHPRLRGGQSFLSGMVAWALVGILVVGGVLGGTSPATAQVQRAHTPMACDPCEVGVVFDGPWDLNALLREGFEQEIAELAAPRHTVVFPADAQRVADWTLDGSRMAVDELLADPDVDIVLTYGAVASSHVISRGELPKPVGGGVRVRSGDPGVPCPDDRGRRARERRCEPRLHLVYR